jgi:hypothetical protein
MTVRAVDLFPQLDPPKLKLGKLRAGSIAGVDEMFATADRFLHGKHSLACP